jgi:S1-C subfamily serine protease
MSYKTERLADDYADQELERENVVGIAAGKDKVLVLVEEKKPLDELEPEDVVPTEIEGVETDVIEVGKIEAKLNPGTSIGLSNAGTGTAGAVVRDLEDWYVLTNNHVAANTNRAIVLSAIHSPGRADGIGPRVGALARFQPIWFNRDNLIDAALVRLDSRPSPTHPDWSLTPRVGWDVVKVGRTTGRTTGKVEALNATVNVNMGAQGTARFRNQIMTSYMLAAGDSGSLLTSSGGHPVGLGFAGSDTRSFHNSIQNVKSLLGVHF